MLIVRIFTLSFATVCRLYGRVFTYIEIQKQNNEPLSEHGHLQLLVREGNEGRKVVVHRQSGKQSINHSV